MSQSQKQDLLQYILLDLEKDCLQGLELLPLGDGTCACFSVENVVFLESSDIINLFPGHEKEFISPDIGSRTKNLLEAFTDVTSIHKLSASVAVRMMQDVQRRDFKNFDHINTTDVHKCEEWLRKLWELIQSRFRNSMDMFTCVPIFPVYSYIEKGNFSQLSLHSLQEPIIYISSLKSLDYKEDVFAVFRLLSISQMDSVPNWIDYGLINQFLQTETSDDVISLLSKVEDESVLKFNQATSVKLSSSFLKYLSGSIHSDVGETCKGKLRLLKLFSGHISVNEVELLSLQEQNQVFAGGQFPVRFPERTILVSSETEKSFAKHIGATIISEYELVLKSLMKIFEYSSEEREVLVRWNIQEGMYFDDSKIRSHIAQIAFLKNEGGTMQTPSELFDPLDETLVKLFRGQQVFPLMDRSDHLYISRLKVLGLKTRDDLTAEDIERQCDVVHKMASRSNVVDKDKCRALLKIMNIKSHLVNLERISTKRFVYVEDLNIAPFLEICQVKSKLRKHSEQVYLPAEVKSMEFAALVSSVSYLIDCQPIPDLSRVMGWLQPPKVAKVAQQLLNIVQSYKHELKAKLLPLITAIYEWFSKEEECCIEDVKQTLNEVFLSSEKRYVWTGNGFEAPEHVCIEQTVGSIDMQPFVYRLPEEIQHLAWFFDRLGCRMCLDFDVFAETLKQINEASEGVTRYSTCPKKKLLGLAVSILNKIKQEYLQVTLTTGKELYFPVVCSKDDALRLKPTKECAYCDAEWLKDIELEQEHIYLVHPDVPISTAAQLGVPSLTSHMLSGAEAFEEWGQEEPLTRRLQTLLKEDYVDGFSVAKELFQNADDAKASKLWLLYDERENLDSRSQLLNAEMAECQGPAIWVYNDAKFSSEDLKNIKQLGGASKKDDATKIGKFGLGFCAVYNITDVPSFITGSNFVIFDPHSTFLGNALPGKSPGLRITLDEILMKRLKNQLKPFEGVFGCSLLNCKPHFEGTLFRLPLWMRRSEISDTVYQSTEVKLLFAKIMKLSANMLIFNQCVQEIKLFHIPQSDGNPLDKSLLFKVSKRCVQLTPFVSSNCKGPIVVEAAKRKHKRTLKDNPIRVLEKVIVDGERHCDENLQISGRRERISCTWLVGWSSCTNERTMKLSYIENGAVPLGAVALPVQYNISPNEEQCYEEFMSLEDVQKYFYQTGHLFFFLPLPIEHRFPFHINGQFTVTSDRRQLKTSAEDDKNTEMKEWNKCLLQDSVTQALLFLLEKVHELGNFNSYRFYSFWPGPETSLLMQTLTQSFYDQVVGSRKYKVFERNGQWFDISECVFIESVFRSSEVGDIAFEFLSHLKTCVVDVPQEVYEMLIQANEELINEKTVNEISFFLNFFLPNLDWFTVDALMIGKRNTLLCHAVHLHDGSVDVWLKDNPCIPSRPNGCLKRPADLVDPHSEIAILFETSDEVFPDKVFEEKYLLNLLCELGLISNILSDNLVRDRASSVKEKSKHCDVCAFERSGSLLLYMSANIMKHKAIIEEIQAIEFIPVKSRPKSWHFKWKADTIPPPENCMRCCEHSVVSFSSKPINFCRPSDLYHHNCQRIVGSLQCIFAYEVFIYTKGMRGYNSEEMNTMLKTIGIKGISHQEVHHWLVIEQLEIIALSEKNSSLCNHSDFHESEKTVVAIYKYLDVACQCEVVSADTRALLQNKAVVWMSGVFVLPKIVAACKWYSDCKPYFYKLDESPIRRFKVLTESLGIKEYLEPYDIALMLQSLQEQKDDRCLSENEIRTVVRLLQNLHDSMKIKDIKDVKCMLDDKLLAIYGPDDEGILRDLTKMCFNDFADLKKSQSMIYSNALIPKTLAKQFGVIPKLMHNLEEESEDIEDYFQEEPLIDRLKRLVEGYPFDSGVFKELIQNADDAQATEIHFLKDYVTHPTRNVMNEKFKPLQGPALCVFNDTAFSKEDLTGIKKLGVGSKSEDPSKTGRYGVGFNTVYNVTDVPSFYTRGEVVENGETLCFFDPLAKYIPNVEEKRPGKMYKNVKRAIRDYHDNVMCGYHEDFFMPQGTGTVFRLPLRSDEMTQVSTIKQDPVSMCQIANLLDLFFDELKDAIVFLKNLKKVTISSHTIYGYFEEFCVDVHIKKVDANRKNEFVTKQTEFCKALKSKIHNIFKIQQSSVTYELLVTSKNKRERIESRSKCIVVQTLGFKKEDIIPDLVKKTHGLGETGLLPHGGVALYFKDSNNRYESIVADQTRSKAFCFLPLPVHTGLPVHVHGYFALDNESRRGLWRAEEESSCHKTLWNLTLIEQVVAPAYVSFLEYAKTRMFRNAMGESVLFSSVVETLHNYQALFPLTVHTSDYYWEYLLKCTYRELVSKGTPFLPVLKTGMRKSMYARSKTVTTRIAMPRSQYDFTTTAVLSWTPLKNMNFSFPAYAMQETETEGHQDNDVSDLSNTLLAIGMRITSVTKEIQDSMAFSQVCIESLEPKHVIDFLLSFESSKPDRCLMNTKMHISDTVLGSENNLLKITEYCLSDVESFIAKLRNIPLILTQDGIVQTLPTEGYIYVEERGLYWDLFPTKLSLFLHRLQALLFKKYIEDYESKSHNKLKQFTLQSFVKLLKQTAQYKINTSEAVPWNKTCPSVKWIQKFWNFFLSLIEVHSSNARDAVYGNLQIINMIPLIPILEHDRTKTYLVPPVSRKKIIDASSFVKNESLYEAIKTMKLPEVDQDVIRRKAIREKLSDQIPNFKSPIDIVECLYQNLEKISTSGISPAQATCIIQYFNDFIPSDTCVDENKLKKLPIFVTHFKKCVAIMSYMKACVVPEGLPPDGLEELATNAKVLLLQDIGTKRIFQKLNIRKFGIFEVYTHLIIPHQSQMKRISFYRHIEFLAHGILSESDESSDLLSMLRKTPFIDTADNRMVRVCDLFDSTNEVFRTMCKTSELLPEQLRKHILVRFLILLGLKTKMTRALFERFAREVEYMGCRDGLTHHVISTSELLLKHLFSMSRTFFSFETFVDFSKVKFIPPNEPDEKLLQIHASYNCQKLISFENSVLGSSVKTCWTVSDLLSNNADPSRQIDIDEKGVIKKLRICRQPRLTTLIRHCENLGRSVNEKLKKQDNRVCLKTLQSVFDEIYRDLKTYMDSGELDDSRAQELRRIPFIYIPELKQTVLAKTVVISCKEEEEIPPYLNKCPDEYIQYKEMFLLLSARKDVSCDTYAFVLSSLNESCNTSNILLPKEQSDAAKAMELFFIYLTQQSEETTIQEKHKFLLSEKYTLEYCRNLVVKNNFHFYKQVVKCPSLQCKFLLGFETFDKYNLKMENCVDCLKFLPDRNRPYLLTDIIRERVVLENIVDKDIRVSKRLEDFIHSHRFIHGFVRLIKHIWKNEGKQWTCDEESRLENYVKNISFRHAKGIETLLVMDIIENGEISYEQLLDTTKEEKSVHIEKTENKCCVFFNTADNKWLEDIKSELAVHLNGAVGKCLQDKHLMRLREIIGMDDSPEQICVYLSKEKIEEYESVGDIDEALACPKPGAFVSKELHEFLDNSYVIFEFDYKFIALEIEDPALNDDTDRNMGDELDPTYIYVHILRKIGSNATHPLLQEYEIDDGTDSSCVVKSCKLFKFVRKGIKHNKEKRLVIYAREIPHDEMNSTAHTPSLKSTLKDIMQCLKEAWKEPVVGRRSIVKRLLLKWHPDKNPDSVSFCTKVFQYIQQCIRRLEKGMDLIDDDFNDNDNNAGGSEFSSSAGEYWSNSWFGRFWERREQDRNSHRQHNSNRSNDDFDDRWNARSSYFTAPEPQPYPYPAEARRWQKQAVSDVHNSTTSLQRIPNNSFNWICYMAHQAAEKSLKAAWYAKDANKIHGVRYSHNLSSIASGLGSDIEKLAGSLASLTGEHTRMRYPDAFYGQQIPAEAFNRQTTETVVSVAKQIIDIVQNEYIR